MEPHKLANDLPDARALSTYRPTHPAQEKWLFDRESIIDAEGPADESAPDELDRLVVWLLHPTQPPREVSLKEVPELVANPDNFVWVQVRQPTRQGLRRVADLLGLHQDTVEIALGPWRRPRLDIHERTYFLSTTIPRVDPSAYRIFAGEFDLFVDKTFAVSAHKQPPEVHERVMVRARQGAKLMAQDSSFLTYIVLDELLEYYENLCDHLQEEIETAEERALTDFSEAYLGDVLRLKRYAFALERLAEHHWEVFAMFLKPDFPFSLPKKIEPYFQGLHARLSHLLDKLTRSTASIKTTFDIYTSRVSQRTDDIVKTLTVITGFTLPLSLVIILFHGGTGVWEVFGVWGVMAMSLCLLIAAGVSAIIFYLKDWW